MNTTLKIKMNTTLEYNTPGLNHTDNGSTSDTSDADLGRMINIIARPCIVAFGTVGKISFYDLHFILGCFWNSHGITSELIRYCK